MSTAATTPRPSILRRPWLQGGFLLLLAIVVLIPSLKAGFIWDDAQQIVDSPTMTDPAAPLRFFSLNVVESWGSEGRGGDGVDTYRPVFFVTLWLVHTINGADPFWFHLAVLAAHLTVCLLLWGVARRWGGSELAAACVFMAFAIHPVTAEAYLWVSAISEPMAVAGLLGAVLILDRWGQRDDRRLWSATAAAGLVMLAGLLAKEAVVTALPVVSLYLVLGRGVRLRALLGPWIAVIVFAAMRIHTLEGLQATGAGGGQRIEALRNLPVLVIDGLGALIALRPVGIRHLFWDYRDVSWAESLSAAAAVVTLLIIAWLLRRRTPLFLTALGVTICMLAPVALLTTVPGWGGFGRYLYLPWAFLLLAAAEVMRRAQPWLRDGSFRLRSLIPIVVIVFLTGEIVGLQRAFDVYHSQESLARASVEIQPHAPDGWEWLGNHHVQTGDLQGAVRCYAEAVSLEPSLERPRHNLAAALLLLGRPAEALEHETAVDAAHGVGAEGAHVAASACMELGRWEEAGRWLTKGLDRDPANKRLLELQARWIEEKPGSGD